MATKLYRIYLDVEYIVPEDQIERGKDWLDDDVKNLVKHNETGGAIAFELAPDATEADVHPFFWDTEDSEEEE